MSSTSKAWRSPQSDAFIARYRDSGAWLDKTVAEFAFEGGFPG